MVFLENISPVLLMLFYITCSAGCASYSTASGSPSEPAVNRDRLYKTVKYLTDISPSRNYSNIDSLNLAANFIKKNFSDYGFKPVEQRYTANGNEYKNIIATTGPRDAPRIIVGAAHYDVCGDQPGADDNGSAVAGLLELMLRFTI